MDIWNHPQISMIRMASPIYGFAGREKSDKAAFSLHAL
jgi:hypothetical protein